MISNKNADIQAYLTPYKYGKQVLTGSGRKGTFDYLSVDIPFVFYHKNQFYMMYTGYDGIGYQTALAVSGDLLNWEHEKVILERSGNGRWDSVGAAGTWIIKESDNIRDLPVLKKIDGKYWIVFHSYPGEGYEAGPAEIGLAWCEDEELTDWHKLEEPVLSWRDGKPWENGGLYKACVVTRGDKYYMYYNAKTTEERWIEQTGLAVSENLREWTRCESNPVLPVSESGWDSKFLSDPYIVKDGSRWVNFFFGYDYSRAQEGLALSNDMINWEKAENPIISTGNRNEIDEIHAHKASIVYYRDVLYHFYTACRNYQPGDITNLNGEFRCITVAASNPF